MQRVRLDEAELIALAMPAIVDDDILIPRCFHAACHHRVCGLANEILINVAGEFVPTVPTHGRGERQPFEFLSIG